MPRTYSDYADHTDVFVKRTGPGRKGLVFPVKLFLLLKYIDLNEPHLQTIISWNHHGRSFKIHNQKHFRQIILPRFYATTSNETFRRQLSFWGFKRISAAGKRAENGSYYHEKFLRSKDYLCRMIRRNESSGPPPPDGTEPNFENMNALPPSDQRRLMRPESDEELFELLLSSPDYAAVRRRTNNATTPCSTVDVATVTSTTTAEVAANTTTMLNSSLTSNVPLDRHTFSFVSQQQEQASFLRRTGRMNLLSSSLLFQTLHAINPKSAATTEKNDPSNATTSMRPSSFSCNNFVNQEGSLLFTSLGTNHVSNFNSTGSTENSNTHATTSIKPNHDLAISRPFCNTFKQEKSLVDSTSTPSTKLSTQQQILNAENLNKTVATEQNEIVADIDGKRPTYENIDLEQLLSDENECKWRHLQPFPIGFQPPLSQEESKEMEKFMDFVRRKSKSK